MVDRLDSTALFQPLSVGRLQLRNRLVAAPVGSGFVDQHGAPTPRTVDLYRRRAAGGAALVTLEVTHIAEPGGDRRAMRLANRCVLPSFSLIADAIHEEGALAALQITNAWHTDFPYRMSALPRTEVERIIQLYVTAAERIREAGFDMVNLQAANGWPLHRFLSPITNDRADIFGEPTKVLTDVIEGIRQRVGTGLAIAVRLSIDELVGDLGITPETCRTIICPAVEAAGADLLDLTRGRGPIQRNVKQYVASESIFTPSGHAIDQYAGFRDAVGVPVAAVARITSVDAALRALQHVDLVALGRQMLADPDFPKKILQGRTDDINRCIACDYCHDRGVTGGRTLACAINFEVGRHMPPLPHVGRRASERPTVVVGGAGIAGLTAAVKLAEAGFAVEVWEREPRVGGLLTDLTMPDMNMADIGLTIGHLVKRLNQLEVPVRCGWTLTPDRTGDLPAGLRAVVLATGCGTFGEASPWWKPGVVHDYRDYLRGSVAVGQRAVVLSGGEGAEVAVALAGSGRQVWLVATSTRPVAAGYDYFGRRSEELTDRLQDVGVQVICRASIAGIEAGCVVLHTPRGALQRLSCDTIIAAGRKEGAEPGERLAFAGDGVPVYRIGDRLAPRGVGEATEGALGVARGLAHLWS